MLKRLLALILFAGLSVAARAQQVHVAIGDRQDQIVGFGDDSFTLTKQRMVQTMSLRISSTLLSSGSATISITDSANSVLGCSIEYPSRTCYLRDEAATKYPFSGTVTVAISYTGTHKVPNGKNGPLADIKWDIGFAPSAASAARQ